NTYKLKLPDSMSHIHPVFNSPRVALTIRPYIPNNDMWFSNREAKAFYEFGNDNEQEWFVKEIIHKWTNGGLQFRVQWTLGDITWEPLSGVKELEALDRHLELCGVKCPHDLP
ncbi:hypothetical protein M422DRAFT_107322, partial [Sphaerobolus stellatus SS14]